MEATFFKVIINIEYFQEFKLETLDKIFWHEVLSKSHIGAIQIEQSRFKCIGVSEESK